MAWEITARAADGLIQPEEIWMTYTRHRSMNINYGGEQP